MSTAAVRHIFIMLILHLYLYVVKTYESIHPTLLYAAYPLWVESRFKSMWNLLLLVLKKYEYMGLKSLHFIKHTVYVIDSDGAYIMFPSSRQMQTKTGLENV